MTPCLGGAQTRVDGSASFTERVHGSDSGDEQAFAYLSFHREFGVGGMVSGSLARSTAAAGVPAAAMLAALQALETALDLERDVREGDRFYVRWKQDFTLDDRPIGTGRVLWVELKTKVRGTVVIRHFRPLNGPDRFWLASGKAASPPALRLPLDKVTVSSGFGLRADPLDQPQTVPPVVALPVTAAPQAVPPPSEPAISEENRKEIARAVTGIGVGGQHRGTTGGLDRNSDLDRIMAERRIKAREAERKQIEEQAEKEKAAREAEEARANPPPAPAPKRVLLFMHEGLDLVANIGTPVYAAADGTVVGARPNGLYGNWIRIDHADRLTTVYGHLSRFAPGIEAGAVVTRGEVIGFVGSTGRSTGAHLHFELLSGGKPVNPQGHAATKAVELRGVDLVRFRKEVARDLRNRDHERAVATEAPTGRVISR